MFYLICLCEEKSNIFYLFIGLDFALPLTFMHVDAILIHVSMKTFGDLKKMDRFIIY